MNSLLNIEASTDYIQQNDVLFNGWAFQYSRHHDRPRTPVLLDQPFNQIVDVLGLLLPPKVEISFAVECSSGVRVYNRVAPWTPFGRAEPFELGEMRRTMLSSLRAKEFRPCEIATALLNSPKKGACSPSRSPKSCPPVRQPGTVPLLCFGRGHQSSLILQGDRGSVEHAMLYPTYCHSDTRQRQSSSAAAGSAYNRFPVPYYAGQGRQNAI